MRFKIRVFAYCMGLWENSISTAWRCRVRAYRKGVTVELRYKAFGKRSSDHLSEEA